MAHAMLILAAEKRERWDVRELRCESSEMRERWDARALRFESAEMRERWEKIMRCSSLSHVWLSAVQSRFLALSLLSTRFSALSLLCSLASQCSRFSALSLPLSSALASQVSHISYHNCHRPCFLLKLRVPTGKWQKLANGKYSSLPSPVLRI